MAENRFAQRAILSMKPFLLTAATEKYYRPLAKGCHRWNIIATSCFWMGAERTGKLFSLSSTLAEARVISGI